MFKKVDPRKKYAEMEKEVLKFWKEKKVFEKSVDSRPAEKLYSFYDGPPFITGVPHHGTLLSSIVKDCVPRFWTMKGFRVERVWGWDCHGLPAENMVENKLGIKSKREIEEKVGIEKFIQTCYAETSQIASQWEEIVDRIGRWVHFQGAYKTMDRTYMESVWWAFSELHKKGLVYEDVRVSLFCPRCSTPLANFEIAMDNSYQLDKDTATFVRFQLDGEENRFSSQESKAYFLVWTTTPWTLLANVALAVNPRMKYVMVRTGNDVLILAKELLSVLADEKHEVIQEFSGKDLVGLRYQPIFSSEEIKGDRTKAYRVVGEDFVSAEDGTGIVHLAPAFGEDDFVARQKHKLPIILNVDEEGSFTVGKWQGEKVWEANDGIVDYLEAEGFLFKKEEFEHSYPHCHRCHTKLIYKAQSAWYVAVEKMKKELLENNEKINWFPAYFKEGRFKKGIETAPDWNISRDRYWGTAMPVWRCVGKAESSASESETTTKAKKSKAETDQGCGTVKIVGSYGELKDLSGKELEDYHRPYVDEVTFECEKCGGTMRRIPQVFDCWVESGSMPYAQFHYPFENKEKFEKGFPADFIAEYVGQVRAWFYVLHAMSTGVFGKESFKNVIVTGNIQGNDGRKMSKSLGNYTDPKEVLEKYSADALRFFLLSSPLLSGKDANFSEEAIKDIQHRLLGTFWNSYSFFMLYASVDGWQPEETNGHEVSLKSNLLDRWIMSELHGLIKTVDENMQKYDIVSATKPIAQFVDDLSNWYIRRSRRRFWKSESDADKKQAYATLWTVLTEFSKVFAPFCPFVAEEVYRNLTNKESVHLADFPLANEDKIDEELSRNMAITRKIIELGLSLRAESGIKVRQPLGELQIADFRLQDEFLDLIKEEVNVKEVKIVKKLDKDYKQKEDKELKVGLDVEITDELRLEGQMRELVRHIQQGRKEAGFQVEDRIEIGYQGGEEIFDKFETEITKEVLAEKVEKGELEGESFKKEVSIDDCQISFWLKKVF